MESLAAAIIDLDAFAHNVRLLGKLNSAPHMMAVVKADAYGHGAAVIAISAIENGADRLAVARLSEAILLRKAGIKVPILLFGYTPPSTVKEILEYQITIAVHSYDSAKALSDCAQRCGAVIKIHVKVDTGMGRLGLVTFSSDHEQPDMMNKNLYKAEKEILDMARLPGIQVEGIFTHFANADRQDKQHAEQQFSIFSNLLRMLKKSGLEIPIRHAANSAATISMPQTHLDMVRPGIAMYGLWPSNLVEHQYVDLRPVMTLSSQIVQIKEVPAGFRVSYGSTYETVTPTRIATVAIGYADGLNRMLSSKGCVLINGQRCPIIGRVCMDYIMTDISLAPQASEGDEVVVIGRQKDQCIYAEELAFLTSTINYEVVTSISPRVERIYKCKS